MSFSLRSLKKIDHLVRYFFIFGILVFLLYHFKLFNFITMFLVGVPFYLGYYAQQMIPFLPSSRFIDHFIFLMPIVIAYYTAVGGLLKTLWNEKGSLGSISFGVFLLFTLYMHYTTGKKLLGYFFAY